MSEETTVKKEKYEEILEELVHYLKEANPKTCSKKNMYEKEWAEYNAKHDAICNQYYEDKITEEEQCKMSVKLINENVDLIKKYTDEQKLVFAYQRKCKTKALELLFEYFDSVRLSDYELRLYYDDDEEEQ